MSEEKWTDTLLSMDNKLKGIESCECDGCEHCHKNHVQNKKVSPFCSICEYEWCATCCWTGYDEMGADCMEKYCSIGKQNLKLLNRI